MASEPTWQPSQVVFASGSAISCQQIFSQAVVESETAVTAQKVFRRCRSRRERADCAVMNKKYAWWNVLEGALLQQRSEGFYAFKRQDNAASRWTRLRAKAAKVGKGLSQDENARKLAVQHWLEAIDPQHRYGHNLHFYYDVWENSSTKEPFFYWLDIGEGKDVDLPDCKRSKLQKQQIKYLGPKERKEYEVVIEEGKLRYKKSRELVHTSEGDRWIFVMSTSGRLYVAQKQKGIFQHSSFLAGGAAKAAGRLLVNHGTLELMEAHSGHYHPTQENFSCLMKVLKELGTDFSVAKVQSVPDDLLAQYPIGQVCDTADDVMIDGSVVQVIDVPESKLCESGGIVKLRSDNSIAGETRLGYALPSEMTEDTEQASGALQSDSRGQDTNAFGFQDHGCEKSSEANIYITHAVPRQAERQVSLGELASEEADIARLVLVPTESSEHTLSRTSGTGSGLASLQGCLL